MKKLILTLMIATLGAQLMANPLYNSCKGCHGANGELKAMGKSKLIKDLTAQQIETALKGYQKGSYGGTMKMVMKAQASRLSAEQIKALSEYISAFK